MLIPPRNNQQNDREGSFSLGETLGVAFITLMTFYIVFSAIYSIFIGFGVNQLFVDISVALASIASIALLIRFVKVRKNLPYKDYLGFKKFTKNQFRNWMLYLAIYIVAQYTLDFFVRPTFSQDILTAYKNHLFIPLTYLTLIFPVAYEEVLFRAFMLEGFRNSLLGSTMGIVLTSLLFAFTHFQYDLYYKFLVFCLGVFFGIARIKTNSSYLSITLHFVYNVYAITFILIYVHFYN
jgi:membrane protease YdiL (CAAX protease family)